MISDSVDETYRNVESLARIFDGLAKTSPEYTSGEYVAAVLAVACDEDGGSELGALRDADGLVTAWSPALGSALHPTQLYLRDLDGVDAIAVVAQLDLTSGTRRTTLFTGDDARRWMMRTDELAELMAAGAVDARGEVSQ